MPQPIRELWGVSLGEFAVDERPDPLLQRGGANLGRVELLGKGRGHPWAS